MPRSRHWAKTALEMHRTGHLSRTIATVVGVTPPVVTAFLKEMGLQSNGKPISFTTKMRIDPTKAKRIETHKRGNRLNRIFIFDCKQSCGNEIKLYYSSLYRASGQCQRCNRRTRPYQHIYGNLKSLSRVKGLTMDLTYDDIITFTKTSECHYCGDTISWEEWSCGQGYSRKYNLDRKDNSLGYTLENCVVCCTFCNMLRQDKLTYEEFQLLSPVLRDIVRRRKSKNQTEYT